MDAGERRQPHVAGGLGLLDRRARASRRPRRSRRPGTAPGRGSTAGRPRSAGSRAAPTSRPPGAMWRTASSKRCSTRASSPSIASRRTCSHGSSTTAQPALDLVARLGARARGRRPRSRRATANSAFAAWSHGRSRPVVERAAARGELQRVLPLAVVGHDVGEVVARSAPAGRRRRSRRPAPSRRRRAGARARGGPSTPRSTPRAAARSARSRAGAASPAASSAARSRCAPRLSPSTIHAQPNPLAIASARSGSCAALQASAASMFARSARAKARCSAWRALRTPAVDAPRRGGEPRGVRVERAVGQPGLGHRLERERADAVEQPVAGRRARRRRSPASGPRAGRPRRSPPTAGTSSASSTDSTAGSGAPPANVASAHRPRWSSGNSSS